MFNGFHALQTSGLMLLGALILPGCQTKIQPARPSTVDVRSSLRIELEDGRSIDWDQFMEKLAGSDVILLGEEHDDAVGHAVQLAVVEDVFDRTSGGTLAMEMLERDEQILIDDHADGVIDAKAFAKETGSTSWSGEGSWFAWYQPIIDAAHARDGRVVAANAPRRYVRLARLEGWERIQNMSEDRRMLFAVPETPLEGMYRERFFEIMSPTDHDDDARDDQESGIDPEIVESFFKAQQVWDATMADSVANAVERGETPVILLVGRFHVDHDGGTVTELRNLIPGHRIVTVTLDSGRDEPLKTGMGNPPSDIVVHTNGN
tara:strand:- start:368 stop:1324 length:957 start_codon:yes stop_codon:yes gene_type:complete